MKIQRGLEMVHPILVDLTKKIQKEIILAYRMPIRLFESGRDHDRHEILINKGKTKNIISHHLYNLENKPPLYTTAVDYVFFNTKWSWNLRDSTTNAWYILFGHLVLDLCPELKWGGLNRKSINYCHFELRYDIVKSRLDEIPCVLPLD